MLVFLSDNAARGNNSACEDVGKEPPISWLCREEAGHIIKDEEGFACTEAIKTSMIGGCGSWLGLACTKMFINVCCWVGGTVLFSVQ